MRRAPADRVAAAYSAAAGSWQQGPGLIYDRLADVVLSRSPVPLWGARVLDAGAGTGAASRAAAAAGASRVIARDAGVVRATLKVQELATLVAGARVAAAAVAGQSAAQAQELERVLADFDRATSRLGPVPGQPAQFCSWVERFSFQ